jgi:peroxiredoxin
VRSWASSALWGAARSRSIARIALAVGLVAALVWALPIRRAGDGDHHGRGHHPDEASTAPAADPYERAGVTELTEGQRGPAWRLRRFPEGGEARLEDFARQLVVLNFWATWCTPCTLEMPTLERLWQGYRGRGLVVVGLCVDRGAPRALIEPYVRHLGLTFPILLDPDMKTAGAWRVTGLPATFVIKPGGEVAGMATGPREWDSAEMRALLETLLPRHHSWSTPPRPSAGAGRARTPLRGPSGTAGTSPVTRGTSTPRATPTSTT